MYNDSRTLYNNPLYKGDKMPAGCDFTCMNEDCEQHKSGLVMTAPWPMGKIELVLNAPNVKKKEKFRDGLIKLKDEGVNYACITYPNIAHLDTIAYRLQLWCNVCPCIWNYDIVLTEDCPTFEEALEKAQKDGNVPEKCPSCESKLKHYDDVLEDGIICPFYKEDLQQNRWMAKEVDKESTYNRGE